jgi:hypothetical protein
MCEELKLIQTHLGVWKLEDWNVRTCRTQLVDKIGIYCIKNLINNKVLIGEGNISRRINSHINNNSNNTNWKQDLQKYGENNFRLIWIILEEDEIQRKLIENKLQLHFAETCYNRPRRHYPTQKELLTNTASKRHINHGNIIERINSYTKVQRNYIDECWESNGREKSIYGEVTYNHKHYGQHVLMYILHYGDICGVSSVVHHKCENKRCVNPQHLELVTNGDNIRLYHNTRNNKEYCQSLLSKGLSAKQISEQLNMSYRTVCGYVDCKKSSKYKGVHFENKRGRYISRVEVSKTYKGLGTYKTEIEAAQNRDYYIVKNNIVNELNCTLNFHNIDYNNFIVHRQSGGGINKYLIDN